MAEAVTVAALKQTSPERVTVLLSSGEQIKASLTVVAELRLYTGCELDESALERLRSAAAADLTRSRALEMLSRRAMSVKELRDKLRRKGEPEEAIEAAVRWLEERRFLDDESYAAAVARHYAAKGYGAGRIRSELQRRGLARELWDEALENRPSGQDKLDKFIAARLRDPEDRDQVRKLTAALFRRGYSWEEIRDALRRFQAEAEEE